MHIPDGFVPAQVCAAGYAITGGVTWFSLQQINKASDPREEVPKAALLTAAFFVGSSISLPLPPTSVHLIMNGLLGALLSWYAFPAILIGLLLQAVLLGHGGLITLGVNASMLGIPALLAGYIFQLHYRFARQLNPKVSLGLFSFLSGATGATLAIIIFFSLISLTIPTGIDQGLEQGFLTALMIAYVPVAVLEGIFTVLLVFFLQKVKPELLEK
ncbi:cobalamin (vitamin B12) biosynthesis CbiM protein [[Leptolyngbya] sp. PCC 7376]|uniref:cobalt transporter CbiM n=1 Tax=[Leptolyngbya] sp. PCC 7376 TaxID=111781 RepID=UPI00029F2985|nr:cobalt transporter CbiM [[Leptolyngbya] sp. PCC 7376]AFY36979.1 cobalamin (vitamin B12) biosynthesis CbiM protein [[Leptolyngbya] sp. PCC 7376]